MGARPLSLAPKRVGDIFHRFEGGEGCSTSSYVPSNPMDAPIAPRAQDMTNQWTAPLVLAQRHSDYIHFFFALPLPFPPPPFLGGGGGGLESVSWESTR